MSVGSGPEPGRGPRAAEAIFQATLRLLIERGYPGLTIEGVAELAGVNKTTIYRWWPSKAALLQAAVLHAKILDFDIPDTGCLRDDLITLVKTVMDMLHGKDTGPVVRAVLRVAISEAELADLSRRFFADRLQREAPIFARAAARGELAPDVDTTLLVDLIGGAFWFRTLFRQLGMETDFAQRAVDAALNGITARTGTACLDSTRK